MNIDEAKKWLGLLKENKNNNGLIYNENIQRIELWLHGEMYKWVDIEAFFDNPMAAIEFLIG